MRWSKQTWVIATFLGKALTFFIFSEKRSLCYFKSFVCRSPEQVSEGSGKTLEEEEASSLSFTPQDLLDSSGRFVVNHGVCVMLIVLWKVEEVRPLNQKEVVSFGKGHGLTNNYRSVALVNVKPLLPPPYPYHY
uniref:Uncharacterized protein n=1 Tax=Brassica oleracea TaxID=3712 RepID=A0A3P6EQN8_BRAOL|nr:unnamed protein product [Brassica oleracea]